MQLVQGRGHCHALLVSVGCNLSQQQLLVSCAYPTDTSQVLLPLLSTGCLLLLRLPLSRLDAVLAHGERAIDAV
jgi:hypothetical protein